MLVFYFDCVTLKFTRVVILFLFNSAFSFFLCQRSMQRIPHWALNMPPTTFWPARKFQLEKVFEKKKEEPNTTYEPCECRTTTMAYDFCAKLRELYREESERAERKKNPPNSTLCVPYTLVYTLSFQGKRSERFLLCTLTATLIVCCRC